MKVGIITLNKNPNYGNVLQNIALQNIIRKLGFEAETIRNLSGSTLFPQKRGLKKHLKILFNYNGEGVEEKRRIRFVKCCEKFISYSSAYYDGTKIIGNIDDYSSFVAGSDQIWNPNFGVATDFEFLKFAPKHKRISYAASIGVSDFIGIDKKKVDFIKNSFKEMRGLSVREKAGKNLIKEISGIECSVHLDPTMLMTRNDWDNLIYKPNMKISGKYIMVYMLGKITGAYQKKINYLAKQLNAQVIDILSTEYKDMDPIEFVWYIKNAECICTDSFHATVFSIIYHKKFFVFDREDSFKNQNSRFDTLFEHCGIENVLILEDTDLSLREIEWDVVDERINLERQLAIKYLQEQLGE